MSDDKKFAESARLGFVTALIGAVGVTLGHYWEIWYSAYGFIIFMGILVALIWSDL